MPCLPTLMHSNVLLVSLPEAVKWFPWWPNSMVVFATGLGSGPEPAPSSRTSTPSCHTSPCPIACSHPFPQSHEWWNYLIIFVTLNRKRKELIKILSLCLRGTTRGSEKPLKLKVVKCACSNPIQRILPFNKYRHELLWNNSLEGRFFYFSG